MLSIVRGIGGAGSAMRVSIEAVAERRTAGTKQSFNLSQAHVCSVADGW